MIRLEYRLFESKESRRSTATPLNAWKVTSSQDRWLAILKACGTWLRKYPCSRLKLTLTVEFEHPTTSVEPTLEDCHLVFPSLALVQTSKILRNHSEACLSQTME